MTKQDRDFAKSRIEYLLKICRFDERDKEALEAAIKALSQEPTNAVSRDAINNLQKYRYNCGDTSITCVSLESINELPLITQSITRDIEKSNFSQEQYLLDTDSAYQIGYEQGHKDAEQKSGHWIETEYHRWRCSVCREKGMSEWDNIHAVRTKFCPDCGAKMESEDKE